MGHGLDFWLAVIKIIHTFDKHEISEAMKQDVLTTDDNLIPWNTQHK